MRNVVTFVAVLVLGISAVYGGLGVWGLVKADAMVAILELMSRAQGSSFSARNWLLHWRVVSAYGATLGILGVVSAVGMLGRREWGLLLWALVVTVALLTECITLASGSAAYAFEVVEPAELLILFGIASASWGLIWRVRALQAKSGRSQHAMWPR